MQGFIALVCVAILFWIMAASIRIMVQTIKTAWKKVLFDA